MIRDIPKLVATITQEIRQSMDIAVVGMSGGADSTLTATLSSLALGPQQVYALHLPANPLDEETFNFVSMRTAEKLGVHSLFVPIGHIAQAINNSCMQALQVTELSRVNAGNARARARMSVLYCMSHHLGEAQQKRARVVGTGNLSEDFIGYDTKGGDALADLFPIGDLFKSEVYQLLEYLRDQGLIEESMINRIPSAGFWHGHTDEEELGYTYAEMEGSIRKLLKSKELSSANETDLFVLDRHLKHKHKHEASSVVPLRHLCD